MCNRLEEGQNVNSAKAWMIMERGDRKSDNSTKKQQNKNNLRIANIIKRTVGIWHICLVAKEDKWKEPIAARH